MVRPETHPVAKNAAPRLASSTAVQCRVTGEGWRAAPNTPPPLIATSFALPSHGFGEETVLLYGFHLD